MQGFAEKARILGLAIAAGTFGSVVQAGELQPLEEIPSVVALGLTNSCAPYGNFIACSTAVLDYVTGDKSLFRIKADQGTISQDSVIAVYTDGAQAQINPTVGGDVVMDNAYKTSSGENTVGFSTNKDPSPEEQGAGVQDEPDPNTDGLGGNDDDFVGDLNDYWDIQIESLIAGLTSSSGVLRDPVFVFDNNQKGLTDLPDLKLWGLVALREIDGLDGAGNILQSALDDVVFEFRGCDADTTGAAPGPLNPSDPLGCDVQSPTVLDPNNNSTNSLGFDPSTYDGGKSLGDDPLLDQYAAVQRQFCVDTATFNEVACPNGNPPGIAKFDQNLGTGEAEFFGFLPGLTGSRLSQLLADGYDTLSIDLRFFDQTNGFEDLFIIAMGSRNTIPEPGSLALLGLGGLGFAAVQRRRRRA